MQRPPAWISVSDQGFDLEVYFGEDTRQDGIIDFVLYGPYSPGERTDIYDGRGLHGAMTTACLKDLLVLLDEGRSPVDYVRESALEVNVVRDYAGVSRVGQGRTAHTIEAL